MTGIVMKTVQFGPFLAPIPQYYDLHQETPNGKGAFPPASLLALPGTLGATETLPKCMRTTVADHA